VSRLTEVIVAVAEQIQASADELNRLDGEAGDGDLGITMRTASSIVLGLLPGIEGQPVADGLRACGLALARGVPSTAGTLVATGLLRAAAAAAADSDAEEGLPPAERLATLLEAACAGIAERGNAQVGSKTMLDSLVPAAEAVRRSADAGEPIQTALFQAAAAADEGARATASMRAVHGRAGWLAERSAGHEDAGARLVAIALSAAAAATGTPDAGGRESAPTVDRAEQEAGSKP
jgi:dihydroxyacetone kinase-like protein